MRNSHSRSRNAPEIDVTHDEPREHIPEVKPVDMAIAYPVALEELNRSAIHVLDRAHIAVARLKSQHASSENLGKTKEVVKALQDILAQIDMIAPENRKAI